MARNADELTEAELNELVGRIVGSHPRPYATDFAIGMPILEEAGIGLRRSKGTWYAMSESDTGTGERVFWGKVTIVNAKPYGTQSYQVHKRIKRFSGPTMLIAGLRCFVAMHLSDEVNVLETGQ